MLDMWPVCAPHAHARIVSRDASRARAVPGIRAVLLAEDVPGENNVGVSRKDETALCRQDEVLYHQHIVALVVGEIARRLPRGGAAGAGGVRTAARRS